MLIKYVLRAMGMYSCSNQKSNAWEIIFDEKHIQIHADSWSHTISLLTTSQLIWTMQFQGPWLCMTISMYNGLIPSIEGEEFPSIQVPLLRSERAPQQIQWSVINGNYRAGPLPHFHRPVELLNSSRLCEPCMITSSSSEATRQSQDLLDYDCLTRTTIRFPTKSRWRGDFDPKSLSFLLQELTRTGSATRPALESVKIEIMKKMSSYQIASKRSPPWTRRGKLDMTCVRSRCIWCIYVAMCRGNLQRGKLFVVVAWNIMLIASVGMDVGLVCGFPMNHGACVPAADSGFWLPFRCAQPFASDVHHDGCKFYLAILRRIS